MIQSTEEETMKKATALTCLFLDIGGVLLTNGWDHQARERAATHFKLERSHGQVAIASAKAAFQIYNEVFDSDRLRKPAFDKLMEALEKAVQRRGNPV